MKREASARRNTDDNGERVGVMYVGCNMVVDSGGGGLLLGRSLRPSLRPPRHLSLPPSLPPAFWLARPFSPLPREDIKKPTMESAGDGEEGMGGWSTEVFWRKWEYLKMVVVKKKRTTS